MTGTQFAVDPVVAPLVTNWGYVATKYSGQNLEVYIDPTKLKQHSFILDKIADDFVLNVRPLITQVGFRSGSGQVVSHGMARTPDFFNNQVRLLVNSKASPQEIVQQLNQQFQRVPLVLNTSSYFEDYVQPGLLLKLDIRVDLEAKLENGKITIRVKNVLLGSVTSLFTSLQVNGSSLSAKLDSSWSGLFSIDNATRNFTSLLGFGNSGTAFKETKGTNTGNEEQYGAAPAIMALSESIPKPWSYGVVNATNLAGINLGMLNNDSLPDFATLDGTLIRLYYGAADLQSTFQNVVFSIGNKSTFTHSQQSQIQAGDFNGDGKTDLAVTYDQNILKFAEGAIERRVAIFYAMADKIAANVAAGRTNLPFSEADVNIMAGDLNDRFGFLSNASGIDVNRDGVDDLVIAAPKANKLYIAAGIVTSNFAPSNIVELSTMGIAGRGSFLTDTGAGTFAFDNSGSPYSVASGVDRWFRFTTLGDGLSNDVVRLLVPNLPLGSIPKLTVELFDGAGRSLRAGQSAVSLRGLEAGTYYVHIINKDTQSLNFSLEISPPKDSQVIEALNVRNADKLNAGDSNSRAIPAKPGPQLDVDPVTTLFSNPLLRDAIYKAINKRPGSTVRLSDLAAIAYLSVPGITSAQLTDLNGIERLPNLIVLDLPGHNLSDGALAPLQKLTRLQSLNLRGSNVQISDLSNLPTSLKQLILGSIKDGNNPAQAGQAALELRRLTLLENLQIGTSTTNLIIPETASQDGPASIVNSANNTFQLVNNVAPTVTMPNVITTINEGQLLTFASFMATPGLSITDRDPIVATSVAIVGPAGDQTTLQSQSASPAMLFNKGTAAKFNVPITERMRSNTFTIESWVRVGADADLTASANAPLAIISGGWTSGSGYSLDIVSSNGKYYWSARVKDKSLRLFKLETAVVRDTWVHLALTLNAQGQNSLASLYINGVKATDVNVAGYVPPAIGSNLTIGQGGMAFDEVRIFNKARTAAEIVASKDIVIAANVPNLVGYWNFDDAVTRSNKQVNTSQHATPTDLMLLDGYRTIPAGQFTRIENLTPFAWEGTDTISFRYNTSRIVNGSYYNANVLPYFGVRTISGDYVVPHLGTAFQTDIPNNFSRAWLNYRLKDLVLMTDRKKTLPANEKVISVFFDNRDGYHKDINFSFDQMKVNSRIVQPGQKTAQQLVETTQTIRDLTSFGQNGITVEISPQIGTPTVNFSFFRATTTANNSFTFTDDGNYQLKLTAVDSDGGITTRTAVVAVKNTSPTTDIGGKPVGQVLAGSEIALSVIGTGALLGGKATLDPSPVDAANLQHEWKVSSPAGQVINTTVAPTFKFTPTTAGTYVVTKTSTDPQGASDVDTVTITVNPKVVFTPVVAQLNAVEGTPVVIGLASASSPVSDRATRGYAWTVKQGTTIVVSGTSSDIRFVPADNVPYTIEATISDTFNVPIGPAQTLTGSSTMTFTPRDAAPTVTLIGLVGNSFTTQVGQFTLSGLATATTVAQSQLDNGTGLSFVVSDAGSLDRPRLSINWGDGKSDHDLDPLASARHKFELPGTYDVQLTATEPKSNAKSSVTFQLVVTPVAPTLTIPTIAPINDGQSVTLVPNINYVGSRNPNEKVSWSVVDPAGQVQTLVGREPKFTPQLSGTWGAVVTLEDGFGNVVRSQTRFTVNNGAPTGLTASEAAVVDDSLLRTYTGSVKDFQPIACKVS